MKMMTIAAAGVLCACGASAMGELDEAHLIGTTDKARAIDYAPGETMTFTLALKKAKPFPAGTFFVKWTRSGDDGKTTSGKEEIAPGVTGAALILWVSNDAIFRAIRAKLAEAAEGEQPGDTLDLGGMAVFQQENQLVFATDAEAVKAQLAGKAPSITAAPAFQRYSQGLANRGTGFCYWSEKLGATLQKLATMTEIVTAEEMRQLVEAAELDKGFHGVTTVTQEGILAVAHSGCGHLLATAMAPEGGAGALLQLLSHSDDLFMLAGLMNNDDEEAEGDGEADTQEAAPAEE